MHDIPQHAIEARIGTNSKRKLPDGPWASSESSEKSAVAYARGAQQRPDSLTSAASAPGPRASIICLTLGSRLPLRTDGLRGATPPSVALSPPNQPHSRHPRPDRSRPFLRFSFANSQTVRQIGPILSTRQVAARLYGSCRSRRRGARATVTLGTSRKSGQSAYGVGVDCGAAR